MELVVNTLVICQVESAKVLDRAEAISVRRTIGSPKRENFQRKRTVQKSGN